MKYKGITTIIIDKETQVLVQLYLLLCFGGLVSVVEGRKHLLELEDETRPLIHITSFGLLQGGMISVNLQNLSLYYPNSNNPRSDYRKYDGKIGLTLDRTFTDGNNPYPNTVGTAPCGLRQSDEIINADTIQRISLSFDFRNKIVRVACSTTLQRVLIINDKSGIDSDGGKLEAVNAKVQEETCHGVTFPLIHHFASDYSISSYSMQFSLFLNNQQDEGLYNLYFHHCDPEGGAYDEDSGTMKLNMRVVEKNKGENYLSAGEIPLPALFCFMSCIFFIAGILWTFILQHDRRKETGAVVVFEIHYLMGKLLFLKSLSALFYFIHLHYIQKTGIHQTGWASLYYVTHLLSNTLFFIIILCFGTGSATLRQAWSAAQHKKIFLIVISLQVLANVANILVEETESGQILHSTCKVVFTFLDLLCCGAVLFPPIWSIRALQKPSRSRLTDEKATYNLRKLKTFRYFYMILVVYFYFSRIVVKMLLRITVPFQFAWFDELGQEMTTLLFFVLVGYIFRPTANNPFFHLGHSDDDESDENETDVLGLLRSDDAKKHEANQD